jgi:hypothetical protein
LPKPTANRNHQGSQDDQYIAQNPQQTNARAFALSIRSLDRNVSRPQFFTAVCRQAF